MLAHNPSKWTFAEVSIYSSRSSVCVNRCQDRCTKPRVDVGVDAGHGEIYSVEYTTHGTSLHLPVHGGGAGEVTNNAPARSC